MSTVHGVSIVCVYEFRRGFCTSVLSFTQQAGVQGIYCASVSNIDSAIDGTAYVVSTEAFILWLPRLQSYIYTHPCLFYAYAHECT